MIRLRTAFTFETDDPRIAIDEILKQLDTEHSLLKNSAGFLFCSLDFVSSGTAAEVSGALPFETIGCTTHGIALPGIMDENMLAVAVLTSDDVLFRTGVSGPLDMDGEARIKELYERLSGSCEPSPSLMLVCHANPDRFPGDTVVDILGRISGGTPVFGTNALDETIENRTPLVIYNGGSYPDRLALLAVYGAVESRFEIKSLPPMNIYSKPAIVTEVKIKKEGGKKTHLIFSCFGRSAPLVDPKDEMRLFQKHLEGIPYVFIYSGGEFCPVQDKQGKIRNCFYQFSIISLSF